METTKIFSINEVGQRSGRVYDGKFTVKTLLNRRENFIADERRRFIVGSNSQGVAPSLSGEAYILGQLSVRIVESPKWWTESDNGLDLPDENIIGTIFKLMEEKVAEFEAEVKGQAKTSLEKLTKSATKRIAAEKED